MNAKATFGKMVINRLAGDLTAELFVGLLRSGGHSLLVEQRRAGLIISRARAVALVFAVMTPLWLIFDITMFSVPVWQMLAAERMVATVAFAMVALSRHSTEEMALARRILFVVQLIPTLFFLTSLWILSQYPDQSAIGMVTAGYAFLPFVMVAGLSAFPITLLESALFSLPMALAVSMGAMSGFPMLPFDSYLGALWLLLLLAVVATLSGMSQLYFMMALVNQSARDLLTRAYTRRVGEELMEMLYVAVARVDAPIVAAFIDLDNFKSINDAFGHEEGDRTLRTAAECLRLMLRRNDVLVRWGGEEFLVIMPFTDCDGARKVVQRLRATGLGMRPDGRMQTASIGIAERKIDSCSGWSALVDIADRRMYDAKQQGKNRVVLCDNEVMLLDSGVVFMEQTDENLSSPPITSQPAKIFEVGNTERRLSPIDR